MIDQDWAKAVIRSRPRESHKGDYGRVLLIGGNPPYSGAIIMAALACVRSGAGLVSVATHPQTIAALHAQLPEAMAFDMADKERLSQLIQAVDLVAIGPGLDETASAQAVFDLVCDKVSANQMLLLDGSALNLYAKRSGTDLPAGRVILTPHQMEWERLSGLAPKEQAPERNWQALAQFPEGTLLVAKRHHTQVYDKEDHQMAAIAVGGPYQATGGMGDTLAGMIAAFAVQFPQSSLYQRVGAAVYLHSAIADDLSRTNYVTLPTAISQQIPQAMKILEMSHN
ncbi:NAD(P)H-hydrate dehydratase [Streptococcus sp. DD12]|uniref:NAD(P)H-hydrate dehydratase n=1 Tax=Streptococcus sp. DD12 TaxID=1777880 RepID=UPI00079CA72D|nr:NAD(P)H-hydrate dehydratase [Streptococcus sp. DD12]KXT75336.1 NAD(P)HX dehydratase [Streptococcus sp. DD12]